MKVSSSKRRMMENQVVFRKLNEKVQQGIDEVNQIAEAHGQDPMDIDRDSPLFFYCECSDENCRNRIKITPNEYSNVHQKKDEFTILPGHEVPSIEDITQQYDDYVVVKKHVMPNQSVETLVETPVENV